MDEPSPSAGRVRLVRYLRRWILDLPREVYDPYAKSVLHTLVQYIDKSGRAWPSMERIASESGMSERKAQAVIQRLEQYGVLEVKHSKGRSPNTYKFATNPAHRAGFEDTQPRTQSRINDNPNPACGVSKPRTARHSTPHAVHPTGRTVGNGSSPKEGMPSDRNLGIGEDGESMRPVAGSFEDAA